MKFNTKLLNKLVIVEKSFISSPKEFKHEVFDCDLCSICGFRTNKLQFSKFKS
jgi:hypothetical protein